MLFLIHCLDRPDAGDLRSRTRVEHLRYMIAARGQVVFGGPLLDETATLAVGSVMALDLPNRATLRQFLSDEPYNRAGLFGSVVVHQMRQMSPEPMPGVLEAELAAELMRAKTIE